MTTIQLNGHSVKPILNDFLALDPQIHASQASLEKLLFAADGG